MSIYEKILAIMQDVNHIQKDDTVSYKSTNYKALSEEKVTSIMREKMIEQKLIVFPVKQEFRKDGYISHVDVTYRIVDTETGDSIEVTSCGDGADTQDKGAGKAMTYAYKYMWLRTFAIPTGEDPDKIASAQLDDMEKGKTPEPPKPKKNFPSAPKEDGTPINQTQIDAIQTLLTDAPAARLEAFNKALDFYKVENITQLSKAQAAQLIGRLRNYK